MADRKISDLTALTTPASGDYLPIVDISEAAAASKNKRITIEELFRGVPLGTAAAPSIAIEGDEDTGVFSPGANQLAVATNGTKRLQIDSGGNVAIDAVGDTGLKPLSVYSQARDCELRLITNSGTENNAFVTLRQSGGNLDLYSTNGAITLNPANTERLRITSAGLVGIGTSSPGATLDIIPVGLNTPFRITSSDSGVIYKSSSASNKRFQLFFQDNSGTQTARIGADISGANASNLQFVAGSGTTPQVTLNSSGQVGIGVTSPGAALDILGPTSGDQLRISNNASVHYRIGRGTVGGYLEFYGTQSSNNGYIFGGADGERARIDSSGRLLIGTSTSRAVTAGNSVNWNPRLQVTKTGTDAANIAAYSFSTYAVDLGGGLGIGPDIVLARSNSDTEGTQTAIANNMLLGRITFNGSDGTAFQSGAFIAAASDGQTWASGDCPTRLVFSTTSDSASSPTERMRITSDAYVRLAAGTGGIQFNGDTAAANALDDYEEGTWTPVINTSNGDATVAWSLGPNARYTKIGRQIHLVLYGAFTVSAAGTGYPIITGVPITAATAPFAGSLAYASGFNSASIAPKLYNTTIDILNTNSVSAGPGLQTGYIALFMSYTV
jgi:hypothetical protein